MLHFKRLLQKKLKAFDKFQSHYNKRKKCFVSIAFLSFKVKEVIHRDLKPLNIYFCQTIMS